VYSIVLQYAHWLLFWILYHLLGCLGNAIVMWKVSRFI
jgi:hypothetical protein